MLSSVKSFVKRNRLLGRVRRMFGDRVRVETGADDVRQELAAARARLDLLEFRVGGLEPRVDRIEVDEVERIAQLEIHMPTVLNSIASAASSNRRTHRMVEESVAGMWERIEFFRREALLEVRYAGGQPSAPEPVEAQVVDEERLAAARAAGLRVNLGCGHRPMEDYVNVDMRLLPGVDVVAQVDDLPFEPGELGEMFSSHLFEHFPQDQVVRKLLPYWVTLIRPGGVFRVVLPDAGAMLTAFSEGTVPYEDLREVLYGGQEYEGDFHFNMYTVESLTDLLTEAGLVDVEVEAEGRRNGLCLEMQISARVPG
jgi:predicted SAM-dependent methyltransferase